MSRAASRSNRARATRVLDPAQSAAVAIAVTAASDEEFAAGVPLTDPGRILVGEKRAKKKEAKPTFTPAQLKALKKATTVTPSRGLNDLLPPVDTKKLSKAIKKRALQNELEKRLLKSRKKSP